MRLNRSACGAMVCALVITGGRAQQACTSNPATTDPGTDSGKPAHDAAGVDAAAVWAPGDGGPCSGPVGGFPPSMCDPSDEQVPGCLSPYDAGCNLSPKCGDPNTCEPLAKNPPPGTGTDNFRMRLLNLTAPPSISNFAVQSLIVTSAVDLPASPDAGGASCGENGTGLFSWLLTVDKSTGTVVTGGAPPTKDPFDTGYCFTNGTIGGIAVAPIKLQATFTGNTFDTAAVPGTVYVPVFQPSNGGVIMLPVSEAAFHDVTISDDGNCIGSLNQYASYPQGGDGGVCINPMAIGTYSCSRWHSAGTLAGYITLKNADAVQVPVMEKSLCVLLVGEAASNGASPAKCTEAAFTQGDYSSSTHEACSGGSTCDSFWLSGQFAASAVKITDGPGISLCNGGSMAATPGG